MPSPYVKNLAKDTGKSEKEIEKLWDKAKDITADFFNKKEKDFKNKEYAYAVGTVKSMLGIKEKSLVKEFMESEKGAKEFLEVMVSGQFSGVKTLEQPVTPIDITPEFEDDENDEEEYGELDDFISESTLEEKMSASEMKTFLTELESIDLLDSEGPEKTYKQFPKTFKRLKDVEDFFKKIDMPDTGYNKVKVKLKFKDGEITGFRYDHGKKDPSFIKQLEDYIRNNVTLG